MRPAPIPEGARCKLNGSGCFYMNGDARPFFHAPIEVVRITKAGFVQVRMTYEPSKVYSVPRKNVDLLPPLTEQERATSCTFAEPIPLADKNLRYWVFAWNMGGASGGLGDLAGTYNALSDAFQAAEKEQNGGAECWNILDVQSMCIVAALYHGIGPDGIERKVGT